MCVARRRAGGARELDALLVVVARAFQDEPAGASTAKVSPGVGLRWAGPAIPTLPDHCLSPAGATTWGGSVVAIE